MIKSKYRKYFLLILFTGVIINYGVVAQETKRFEQKNYSPDKNYELNISRDATTGKITYQINYKGKTLIKKSRLAISLDNHLSEWALAIKEKPEGPWMEGLVLKETRTNSVDSSWTPVYGERSVIQENYNELILSFEQKASVNYKMDIQLRAYNEGVAIRYYFHTNPTGIYYRITEENTEFTFPEGTQAWFEPWAQGPFTKMPLSDWPAESERPLTLELENGLYACLAEVAMVDFVRTKFELAKEKPNTVKTVLYESVDKVPYFSTPWRVIMAAETPGELIENNDILLNLNAPSKIDPETSEWIKPGKIVRDKSLTDKGSKEWIDFAVEHNLQYLLIDCCWYGEHFGWDTDAKEVQIDMSLKEVIEYGNEKGIGTFLYVNQQALSKQDFELFPLYKEWGVVGVKYGFVQVGSHRWTKWLHESVQRAAENQLMVNIHDEFRVTGEQRTWPNIMTVEGIRGNEEMPDATHNTILPFTRGIAGMGDYTVCYYSPQIKTTHAHQLALSVVMYSPLQTLF
ncbi:glycoside hydrolase family 97 N-terminal domain-containing protein [Galbibacter sp. EGI 63066]|uniref:glycoside hydrolase family 97 N-terminal domain-containing protein n=1 Tax=Galbibacter sp. EGI 63066 TaxID=2993559 RepID=UPI0022493A67|nr:glycoside hydrolase family 97 N-terminal domain-containing protein [Galbibacter sp. EGI 63066]MCX2678659.1 glycoside hydrolase family 97 N-terminal domain-containing protein [Galbibacter sp. EGI 63066]